MTHQIIDISSNQTHPIDWAQVKASGVDAVLVKATEGTTYTNPDYQGDINGARAAGLKVAAYHFARFGDPTAEAVHFHDVAGADAKAVDMETSGDAAWVNAFLALLSLPASEELTYGSASTLPVGGITRGLLWSAAWGSTPPAEGEVLWQYTDQGTVPGITGNVDRSQWIGTEDQYVAFFSGNLAPVPPNPVPAPSQGPTVHPPAPEPQPAPAPAFPPFSGRLLMFPPETVGNDVRMWQQRMQDRTWRITVDGVYGPISKGICEEFQKGKGLTVDGIVGPVTWDACWTSPVTHP